MATTGIVEELATIRAAIEEKKAELARIARAAVPEVEALARLDVYLEAQAARFDTPRIGFLTGPHGLGGADIGVIGGIEAALATICRDAMRAELARRVGLLYAENGMGADAVATADRPRLLDEARTALRALEIDEERLIMQAEAAGLDVDRREDADPAVVLETTSGAEAA